MYNWWGCSPALRRMPRAVYWQVIFHLSAGSLKTSCVTIICPRIFIALGHAYCTSEALPIQAQCDPCSVMWGPVFFSPPTEVIPRYNWRGIRWCSRNFHFYFFFAENPSMNPAVLLKHMCDFSKHALCLLLIAQNCCFPRTTSDWGFYFLLQGYRLSHSFSLFTLRSLSESRKIWCAAESVEDFSCH